MSFLAIFKTIVMMNFHQANPNILLKEKSVAFS